MYGGRFPAGWSYLLDDTPTECFGETRIYPPLARLQLDCRFEPSSSGGPWYEGYDSTAQSGTVNGVISSSPADTGFTTILSPYFDGYTWLLYQEADALD